MHPIILVFISFYLPGYKSGGPVRTIANMVEQLSDMYHFKIVTADRDSFENEPYADVHIDAWNRVGSADVYYISPENRTFGHLRRILQETEYDVVYLNSLFSTNFAIKPLLLRRLGLFSPKPVVLAPRGEFSEGALALKRCKKNIYLAIAKFSGLYRNLTWQASSTHEVADIQRVMGRQADDIIVAPNLPTPDAAFSPPRSAVPQKKGASLKIVFLSRISPKKNLDYAIGVLAHLKGQVQFDLYGIVDDQAYWRQCQDLIKGLPENISVEYKGCIVHEKVFETFSQYDLFFLPTKGENFGHVIYESLLAGTPPLISDQTPWRDFEEKGVGWVLSLDDMDGFVHCIEQFAQSDSESRCAMRERARQYAVDVNQNSDVLQANKNLFLTALE